MRAVVREEDALQQHFEEKRREPEPPGETCDVSGDIPDDVSQDAGPAHARREEFGDGLVLNTAGHSG